MRTPIALATAAGTLILMAGCGSSGTASGTGTAGGGATQAAGQSAYGHANVAKPNASTTTAANAPAATGGALVVQVKHAKLGTILAAGPRLLTVYLWEGDKGKTSACSGTCAAAWPPVSTSATPTAGAGARGAALGTITRHDGTRQVTYNGHPLYFFVQDKDKGDAYGQGVKAFGADWYVLLPSGKKLDKS